MNDPREINFGIAQLQKDNIPSDLSSFVEEYRDGGELSFINDVFATCGSKTGDDVSQWARYTPWPEAGYCVELDPGVPLYVVRHDKPVRSKDGRTNWSALLDIANVLKWTEVSYGEKHFVSMLRELKDWADNITKTEPVVVEDTGIVSDPRHHTISSALASVTRLAKHESFESEQEVRIVTTLLAPGNYVKYRASRYGVVRYLELAAGKRSDYGDFVVRDQGGPPSGERLPIKSITVGPAPYAQNGVRTIEQLLKSNGYTEPNVEVRLSEAQVR